MKLVEYIKTHYYGNQAVFAKAQGVATYAGFVVAKKNFIVINDELYSYRPVLIKN